MSEVTPDDLADIERWHFAVGGLDTQQETLEIGGPISLRRLRGFPTHEQLALSLTSLPVAGAMALYGEKVVRHELVIDAARFEENTERIFPTASAILAGLRIRTGAEVVCPAVCERSWADLRTNPPNQCRALHVERGLSHQAAAEPKLLLADDLDWVRKNLGTVIRLTDDQSFETAVEALCTYMLAANDRMEVAQLWTGVEAIFDIEYELRYRLLMVNLMTAHDRAELKKGKVIRTVYDPCCGSGGMLTIAKERILQINPAADVHLFGQEVNPSTFAVSKSDLYIKSADGRDAENIAFGSVLAHDGHADRTFDYLLANPPYGKDWNLDADEVRKEAARATKNRFVAGLPRINDGQLLFLQHMLGRMHHPSEGVSRVSIIMNGSPLFTGDAGSGESEIRRWIFENDTLEALIALPQQLFYNTGISTYVWVLANTKPADRKGKVILIDASEAWLPRRKSLGDKRRDIPDGVDRPENYIPHIVQLFEEFADGTLTIPADDPKELRAKVFPTTAFGYRKVTIERPLRLNFQASPERIARLDDARAFQNLAVSRLKDPDEKAAAEAAGQRTQQAIRDMLATLPQTLFTDRAAFLPVFEQAVKKAGVRLAAPVKRAVLDALSERDEAAAICRDEDDQPEADPELRDTENVPLGEDVQAFFEREVRPHVPDAWVNETIRDAKDGGIGIVGYEINFNRYFYRYTPPRPLEEIEADIKAVEADVLKLLKEVAG